MNNNTVYSTIDAMYHNRPFQDETGGELRYVPCPVDCLIDACNLFERQFYISPSSISSFRFDWFLKETKEFILSIPISLFQEKVQSLERSSKEIILRNIDRIVQNEDSIELFQYSQALNG